MRRQIIGGASVLIGSISILNSLSGITGFVISEKISTTPSFIFGLVLFIGGLVLFVLETREDKKMIGLLENMVVSSRVKQDPFLLRVSKDIGKKEKISRDINHLIERLNKGDTNPGLGSKYVLPNILELRGRNGGRVYCKKIEKEKYEILGYSDKANQKRVIAYLTRLYS